MKNNKIQVNPSERSFSLLETILAMSVLATVILQIGGAQGHLAYLSIYNRDLTQASLYAKRIMSQVEYQASYQDFKGLELTQKKNNPISTNDNQKTKFTYDIEIKEWKFPILEALFPKDGGGGGAPGGDVVKSAVKQILGDHIIKIAHVEVFWPEGAKRNSMTVTQMLTNIKGINNHLLTLESDYKNLLKQVDGIKDEKEIKTKEECDKVKGVFNPITKICTKPTPLQGGLSTPNSDGPGLNLPGGLGE